MLERQIIDALMSRLLKSGSVQITDWSGNVTAYGDSPDTLAVQLSNPRVAWRLLRQASIATGEAFTEGSLGIEQEDLLRFFQLVFANRPKSNLRMPALRRPNIGWLQKQHIAHHYDLGNDYYELWLDEGFRQYSCAYWSPGVVSLQEAQDRKIDILVRKLQLSSGQRVLDIGCGWGHLAIELARRAGVKVVAVTLSEEQYRYARGLISKGGPAEDVGSLVEFRLQNYQQVHDGPFDRIVSVGMYEHVGRRNQAVFFKATGRLLVPGGVMVLHTITQLEDKPVDAWVAKHVFPGGYLPTVSGIVRQVEKGGFWLHATEDLHPSYARTLAEWERHHRVLYDRVVQVLEELAQRQGLRLTGRQLYRLRQYWLKASEAAFRWGDLGLCQFIITKGKRDDQPTLDVVYGVKG